MPSIPVRLIALVGLLLAFAVWAQRAVHDHDAAVAQAARDRVMSQWQAANAAADQAELAKAQASAAVTVRRLDVQGESHEAAARLVASLSADVARLRDAERVSGDHIAVLEAIAVGAGASDSAALADRQAAAEAARMLADLQRRVDRFAGVVVEYADRARIAGETCERDYDALRAN